MLLSKFSRLWTYWAVYWTT